MWNSRKTPGHRRNKEAGNPKPIRPPGYVPLRITASVMFGPVPLLVFFFAMTMGVNHRQAQNNQAANREDNDDGFILPDFADKCGDVCIHDKMTF